MSYQLSPFAVYSALLKTNREEAGAFKRKIEQLLTDAAQVVAREHKFMVGFASLEEDEFGGLLIPARPRTAGMPLPEVLKGCDDEGEWG